MTTQINAMMRKSTAARLALAGSLALALGLPAAPALAVEVTDQFTVSATVTATCTIAAGDLSFGSYDASATTPSSATSTISVQCTNQALYNVALNAGTFSGATVTTRRMTGPDTAGLLYHLYRDEAGQNEWGVTVGTDTMADTGNGQTQNLTVHGQIPINQFLTAGDYSDTVTATIIF